MFFSKKDVLEFKNLLYYFKRLASDGVTPLIEKQLLLMLDRSIPFLTNLIMETEFPRIHRLTVNRNVVGSNKRIKEIKYLTYPPKDLVTTYGRCNKPGQNIFYGGFSWMTTLNEVGPRVGDLITSSVWQPKSNSILRYSPIFKNQPGDNVVNTEMLEINDIYEQKVKTVSPYLREATDLLLQFIADAFTKRINPKEHLNYIFSAYFSDKIFNDLDNGKIEAIYYPSVHEKLSFQNIAIKPRVFDEKYYLTEVQDFVIVMDPSNGKKGYVAQRLSKCKTFDHSTGRICWETTNLDQPIDELESLKSRFGINFD